MHIDANDAQSAHKSDDVLHDIPEEDSLFAAHRRDLVKLSRGHERFHGHIQTAHVHGHARAKDDISSFRVSVNVKLGGRSGVTCVG